MGCPSEAKGTELRRLKDEWKKQDAERKARQAIEQEKLKRAEALSKMSEEERKTWLELHKDELKKEEQKELEKKMLDRESQEDLRKLADEIRERKLKDAAVKIDGSEKAEAEKEKASVKKND